MEQPKKLRTYAEGTHIHQTYIDIHKNQSLAYVEAKLK